MLNRSTAKLAGVPRSAPTGRETTRTFLFGSNLASSRSGPSLKRKSHCSRGSVPGSCGQRDRPATRSKTGVP
eukprot:8208196-Prorocentrum_lima.AAC.1